MRFETRAGLPSRSSLGVMLAKKMMVMEAFCKTDARFLSEEELVYVFAVKQDASD
jgi:hypothetical protein